MVRGGRGTEEVGGSGENKGRGEFSEKRVPKEYEDDYREGR